MGMVYGLLVLPCKKGILNQISTSWNQLRALVVWEKDVERKRFFFKGVGFILCIYRYTLIPSCIGEGKNIELSKVTLESPIETPKPDDNYYTVESLCVPLVGDHLTHGSTKQ